MKRPPPGLPDYCSVSASGRTAGPTVTKAKGVLFKQQIH